MERHRPQRGGGEDVHRGQTVNEQECPICISEPHFAVKTNCGHLFCGKMSSVLNYSE